MTLTLAFVKKHLPEVFETPRATKRESAAPADVTGRALELWNSESPDASKHDFLFGLALLRGGHDLGRVRELLPLLPCGKMGRDGRGEDYFEATIRSIDKVWKREESALARVKKLRSADAFLPENVAALATVFELNRAVYEKALRKMRKKLRIPKLEAEVKKVLAQNQAEDLEPLARCVVDGKKLVGWWLKTGGDWTALKFNEFKTTLDGMGMNSAKVCAELALRPWKLVNVPFGPAEEERNWNKDAARLAFEPKAGKHPTWDQLLRVVGRGLDGAVLRDPWCKANGVKTGGEYLLYWVANVFQRPFTPLPYLFFHGPQHTGKSLFFECLSTLMEPGFAMANEALENRSGFNGEIAGAILCAADEIELTKKAYKRIKLWVTSKWLLIHPKGASAYKIRNSTHWIQTGNSLSDCPLLEDDTRITACEVLPPEAKDILPKDVMEARCAEEAPAFLHAILNLELPGVVGRLGVPILETFDKKEQQSHTRSPLEEWCSLHREYLSMSDTEFANKFLETLTQKDRHEWDRARVLREAPERDRWIRRVTQLLKAKGAWSGSMAEFYQLLTPVLDGQISSAVSLGARLGDIPIEFTKGRKKGVRTVSFTINMATTSVGQNGTGPKG